MLSEAVVASYERPEKDGIHEGQLTVTSISPCSYGTYLNYHGLDTQLSAPGGIDVLRMSDGHWQEQQVLINLLHAGFIMRFTGGNQMTVHVGKSRITGRPDGLILVDGREDVLSIKAMSLNRYTNFRQDGLLAEPFIKCQEQMYLASEELQDRAGCWIYAKHKDTCRPYDLFEEKDLSYSKPIVEALDTIVVGKGEVKKPVDPIDLCTNCRHSGFCWASPIVDLTGTETMSLPDLVSRWKEAKYHIDYGKELMEEVREGKGGFREMLGENRQLLVGDLKVLRIISHGQEFSISKFVELFGANRLVEVMEDKMRVSMRITEVSK